VTTTTTASAPAAPTTTAKPKPKPKAAPSDGFHRDTTPLSPAVTGQGGSGSSGSGSSSVGSVMRMLLGLVIVIGVIFAVYWLLRRTSGRKRGGGVRGDGRISVVSSTQLPSGGAVHLVRVGDELVLVGSSQNGVTPIRTYTADESQRLGVALDRGGTPFVPTGRPAPGRGDFRTNLVEELRRRTTRG
jgi:flagellar protein FliO/FliZ